MLATKIKNGLRCQLGTHRHRDLKLGPVGHQDFWLLPCGHCTNQPRRAGERKTRYMVVIQGLRLSGRTVPHAEIVGV